MIGSFWTSLIKSNPDWVEIGAGIITPTYNDKISNALLGLVGAVIMPHNFYLHSALVLNRDLDDKDRTDENIKQICSFN